jgi:hypothetical protein
MSDRIINWTMLFIMILACVGGAWEGIETMMYGYSQHSAADAVVGMYAAAELAGRIERWIYRLEGDNR